MGIGIDDTFSFYGVLVVVVMVWKGIYSWSVTNRLGAEGLSFYYRRLLYCTDQMLAVMMLSQHRVLSSKFVRFSAPYGARCLRHAIRMRSAVCSWVSHSQFGERAIHPICVRTNEIAQHHLAGD